MYEPTYRLRLLLALLRAGLNRTKPRAAELERPLGAVGLRCVFLHSLATGIADPPRPLGALLLGGVALSDVLTLFVLDGLALNNIVFDIMLVISGIGGCRNC